MSVPVLTEQFFITSMSVVNVIIASGIGKEAISAIGTVDTLSNIIIFFFNSLAIGGTVIVAQYMGRGNINEANEAGKQAIASGILLSGIMMIIMWSLKQWIIGTFFGAVEPKVMEYSVIYLGITVFSYPLTTISFIASGILRSTGHAHKPMKINIAMSAVNIILSYLLIYGLHIENAHISISLPAFGITGAGVAILLARLFGALLFLLALIKTPSGLQVNQIKNFKWNMPMQKAIFGIGLPSGMESMLFNFGKFIQQMFIITLGTVSVASNSIAWSIFGLLIIPGNAFAIVTTTLVGFFMGKEDYEEAHKINLYLAKLSTVFMAFVCIIIFFAAESIVTVYSKDPEVIRLTTIIIKINAVVIPFLWPSSFIIPSGLRGAGDSKYTMKVSVISLWLFRVVVGYIVAIKLDYGIVGLWVAMYFDWILRGVAYQLRWWKRRWIRKII
jgi:putative MATE family efflux protein